MSSSMKHNQANEISQRNVTESQTLRLNGYIIINDWIFLLQWTNLTFDAQKLKEQNLLTLSILCFYSVLGRNPVLCIFVRSVQIDRRFEIYLPYT